MTSHTSKTVKYGEAVKWTVVVTSASKCLQLKVYLLTLATKTDNCFPQEPGLLCVIKQMPATNTPYLSDWQSAVVPSQRRYSVRNTLVRRVRQLLLLEKNAPTIMPKCFMNISYLP